MDWEFWVGKTDVFIRLSDGQIYSEVKVTGYKEPFLSIIDRDGLTSFVNINMIIKIKEEGHGK